MKKYVTHTEDPLERQADGRALPLRVKTVLNEVEFKCGRNADYS